MLFLRRAVENDVSFPVGQFTERYIGAHAHGAADVGHERPHQAVPRRDGPVVNADALVRHKRGTVHGADLARAVAGAAGALAVEGQLLRRRRTHKCAAFRAINRLLGGDVQRWRHVMAVGAAVAGQAGEHEPQTVQQLGTRAEGAADARHTGPLVQRQRGGDVKHLIHLCLGGLGHAAAGVGGQRVKVAARTLGIQHAECQRRFARPGHARNADDFV